MSTVETPMPAEHDAEDALRDAVAAALAEGSSLLLRGSGSKDFYGPHSRATTTLDIGPHRGVVAYEPTELALTVRAGTPLAEVEQLLAGQRQRLAFEPPRFGPASTVGGMVAAGLAGPRRAQAGGVRDSVLGTRIINGRAEALSFGGRVMKNVAGYDLSRLMAGSMGTLAVILEVSLKVLPAPTACATRALELDAEAALAQLRAWSRAALPITASSYVDGQLRLRVEGAASAVEAAVATVGGDDVVDADSYWRALRDQTLPWFNDPRPLWRLSLPPASGWRGALEQPEADWLAEWGGAQRWLRSTAPAAAIRAAAAAAGGHASLFRCAAGAADGADEQVARFTPLTPPVAHFHRQLKQSLDPQGLFSPGRMYPEL